MAHPTLIATCLGLTLARPEAPLPIPERVSALAEQRLAEQFRSGPDQRPLRFNDTACEQIGTYEWREDSLFVQGSDPRWPEPKVFMLTDLIEGKKIDLPTIDLLPPHSNEFNDRGSQSIHHHESKKHLWAWGVLAGVVGGVVAYKYHRRGSAPTPAAVPTPAFSLQTAGGL